MNLIFAIILWFLSVLFVCVVIYCCNKTTVKKQPEEPQTKEWVYKQTGLEIGEIYEIVPKNNIPYDMMIESYEWKNGILYCSVLKKINIITQHTLTISEIKLDLVDCKIYKYNRNI